jgi:hypothetical protein
MYFFMPFGHDSNHDAHTFGSGAKYCVTSVVCNVSRPVTDCGSLFRLFAMEREISQDITVTQGLIVLNTRNQGAMKASSQLYFHLLFAVGT